MHPLPLFDGHLLFLLIELMLYIYLMYAVGLNCLDNYVSIRKTKGVYVERVVDVFRKTKKKKNAVIRLNLFVCLFPIYSLCPNLLPRIKIRT